MHAKLILSIVAVLMAAMVIDTRAQAPPVYAQPNEPRLYIEPGTTILRNPADGGQMQGKVVIDLRSGDVWGFPTDTSAPYPVQITRKDPPVFKPVYLGKFDFTAMKK
jgi:hypothetical protein